MVPAVRVCSVPQTGACHLRDTLTHKLTPGILDYERQTREFDW